MSASTLQQATVGRRSSRLAIALIVLALGAAVLAVPVAADDASNSSERDDEFRIADIPDKVEPPEKVEINVQNADSDVLDFEINASDEHFHLEGEVHNVNENATILLDTGNVSADDPSAYLSATGAELRNISVHANEVDGNLPGGSYHIYADDNGVIRHAFLQAAPLATFDMDWRLNRSEIDDDPIRTVSGTTGLEPGSTMQIQLETSDDESFRLEKEAVVDEDGRFEAAFDLSALPETEFLRVKAKHDGVTKGTKVISVDEYDPEDRILSEQNGDGIAIAYPGDRLELEAAPDQRITGEADLEEGETVDVLLEAVDYSFLHGTQAEVDERGTFEATVNLSKAEPGTNYTVKVESVNESDVQASAPGVIVEPTEANASNGTAGDTRSDLNLNDDESDESVLGAPSSAWGVGALVAGTALSVAGIGVLVGFGRLRSFREP